MPCMSKGVVSPAVIWSASSIAITVKSDPKMTSSAPTTADHVIAIIVAPVITSNVPTLINMHL